MFVELQRRGSLAIEVVQRRRLRQSHTRRPARTFTGITKCVQLAHQCTRAMHRRCAADLPKPSPPSRRRGTQGELEISHSHIRKFAEEYLRAVRGTSVAASDVLASLPHLVCSPQLCAALDAEARRRAERAGIRHVEKQRLDALSRPAARRLKPEGSGLTTDDRHRVIRLSLQGFALLRGLLLSRCSCHMISLVQRRADLRALGRAERGAVLVCPFPRCDWPWLSIRAHGCRWVPIRYKRAIAPVKT